MPKVYGVIYKATNIVNGKMYIGQTIRSLDARMFNHISDALLERYGMYFHNAIRKYGKENFVWEIIAECNSIEELNAAEIEMIEKYNTFGNGYNLTKGGEGSFGFKHLERSKQKLSEMNRGKNNPMYGKHHSEESKRKNSEAHKNEKSYLYGKFGDKHHSAKKYIVITPDNEKIIIYGIRNFCRNYKKEKLYYQNLLKVADGIHKHHKGYKCKRLYEESIICQN